MSAALLTPEIQHKIEEVLDSTDSVITYAFLDKGDGRIIIEIVTELMDGNDKQAAVNEAIGIAVLLDKAGISNSKFQPSYLSMDMFLDSIPDNRLTPINGKRLGTAKKFNVSDNGDGSYNGSFR